MQIPLPKGIRGSKVVPKQTEYLHNLMNVGGRIISRPAVTQLVSTLGAPRGQFEFNGTHYAIWGTKLYSRAGAVLTEVGTILGADLVRFAAGFTQMAIVTGVAGGNYTLTTAGVLTAIADPDLPACIDVTEIDGRFVFVPADGGPLIYSDVGDAGAIGSLSFFDAESLPDLNKAIENIRNDIFALGADSIERFRDVGPDTAPFQRVNNAQIEVGYVGAKIKTKDSLLFVGKDKGNGYGIFLFSEGTAQLVSPDVINELLNRDYTPAELAAITAQRFNWRGADCYVFGLPNLTLLLQGGEWSFVDNGLRTLLERGTWDFFNALLFDGTWYVQGTDSLNTLDDASADTAGKFARKILTYARSGEEAVFTLAYVELGVAQGVGAGTVGLSLSRNGKLWSNPSYRSMSVVGNYDQRLRWQPIGGLGRFDGYAGLLWYTTTDVEIAADSITAQ